MSIHHHSNPFRVLQLPVAAAAELIVQRAEELVGDETRSPDEVYLFRQAREQLLTHPLDRFRHELFEVPDARYTDEDWDQLLREFRRNPVNLAAAVESAPGPSLADFDWAAFLRLVIEEKIHLPANNLVPAVEQPPFAPGYGPTPMEVHDVIFG
jgi:hypothetical protein